MASRFTKAFQLIALALVFSVAQLYVVAVPTRTNTDPGKDKSSVTQPKTETVMNEFGNLAASNALSENQLPTAQAASERMPLTAGMKTTLNRIFSKGNVEARLAAGNTFLSTSPKASFANSTFKTSPNRALSAAQSDDDDDDGNTSKGAWIAVGVIAAVLTIAIIGLRADRNRD
jgi:hypothetical protein